MIYLDNNATTKVSNEVIEEIMPFLTEKYGNPGTSYSFGREVREAINLARERVARLINANPNQIIFTSGGTEANNMVFECTQDYLKRLGKSHIVTDETEHDSVIRSVDRLKDRGIEVSYVPVLENGSVDMDQLPKYIKNNTGLVSIMMMNNETGTSNNVYKCGKICNGDKVLFHTDCVQAAAYSEIDVQDIGCDFLSLSSHKIHGIKGTGALFVKDRRMLTPLIIGGKEQEFGLRGGTENVIGIIAFGKACEIQHDNLRKIQKKLDKLVYLFDKVLIEELYKKNLWQIMHYNGDPGGNGKTINLRFDGIDTETLMYALDGVKEKICISAGSACRSHEMEPSRVLTAMGLGERDAMNSIRVSFSDDNKESDVVKAAATLANVVEDLLNL